MNKKDSQISLKRRLVLSDIEPSVQTFDKKQNANTQLSDSIQEFSQKSLPNSLIKSNSFFYSSTRHAEKTNILAESVVLENGKELSEQVKETQQKESFHAQGLCISEESPNPSLSLKEERISGKHLDSLLSLRREAGDKVIKTMLEIACLPSSPPRNLQLNTKKNNSFNFSKFLLTLVLISNSLLCVNQTYLVNSFVKFKAFSNERIESLEGRIEFYKESLQEQIDDILSKELVLLNPFQAKKPERIHKAVSLKASPKKFKANNPEQFKPETVSQDAQQVIKDKLKADSKPAEEQELVSEVKKDTDYSVIRPREEVEEKKQFSILTNAEYTQYQTTHKAKAESKPREMYSYNQLPLEVKGFYSNRETKKE